MKQVKVRNINDYVCLLKEIGRELDLNKPKDDIVELADYEYEKISFPIYEDVYTINIDFLLKYKNEILRNTEYIIDYIKYPTKIIAETIQEKTGDIFLCFSPIFMIKDNMLVVTRRFRITAVRIAHDLENIFVYNSYRPSGIDCDCTDLKYRIVRNNGTLKYLDDLFSNDFLLNQFKTALNELKYMLYKYNYFDSLDCWYEIEEIKKFKSLRKNIEEKECEIEKLKDEIKKLENENEDLETKIKFLKDEIKNLEDKIKIKEREYQYVKENTIYPSDLLNHYYTGIFKNKCITSYKELKEAVKLMIEKIKEK